MFNTLSPLSTTPERRSLPEPWLLAARRSPPEVRFPVDLDGVVVTAGFVCCAVSDCLSGLFESDDGAGGTVNVFGACGPAAGVGLATSTSKIQNKRFTA